MTLYILVSGNNPHNSENEVLSQRINMYDLYYHKQGNIGILNAAFADEREI